MFKEKYSLLYQTRYCAQEDFSIAVCMNRSLKVLEFSLAMNNYEKINQKDFKTNVSNNSNIVACESNLYEIKENCTFKRYNNSINNETDLPSLLDERLDFCVCSYMRKVYVIGGQGKLQGFVYSCMCYDINSNKWTYVGSLIENRENASCAVFKGKIVVTGGYVIPYRPYGERCMSFCRSNSSESYCFHEDKWTQFSAMLQGRVDHGSVTIKDKLFVIGGDYNDSCEVLDCITSKFVFIKSLPNLKNNQSYLVSNIEAVSIGYKIYVIRKMKHTNKKDDRRTDILIYCYSDEQNACNQESNLQLEFEIFSCAKISKM